MQENLTPQERLERIARIINKGIYLLALKEGWFDDCNVGRKTEPKTILSMEEKQILELCRSRGRITNKDVQDLFGIHRNTATKKLKEIVSKGLLIQNGNGKGSFYVSNVHNAKMCIKSTVEFQVKTSKIASSDVHKPCA